jgi:hypothetical protein
VAKASPVLLTGWPEKNVGVMAGARTRDSSAKMRAQPNHRPIERNRHRVVEHPMRHFLRPSRAALAAVHKAIGPRRGSR